MKNRIFTIVLCGFSALHCNVSHTPPTEPSGSVTQVPWVAGKITSASEYPARPISGAEVSVSWGSGHSSAYTDTAGRFRLQQLPRAIVTLRATTTNCDTVTVTVDLISSDSAAVAMALTMRRGFVPGEICVGSRDTVSLRTFVRFADSRGLSIKSTVQFEFLTDSISADSAQSIQSALSTKPYLTGASFAVKNGRLSVWYFRDLTPDLLRDWETACSQRGLREVPSQAGKFALLLVSPGSEHGWIRDLSGAAILQYICLNVIVTISDAVPRERAGLAEWAAVRK